MRWLQLHSRASYRQNKCLAALRGAWILQSTEKLYEQDSMLRECQAIVLDCRKQDNDYAVTLDKTIIFPEGGGQPSDKGTINGVIVRRASESDGRVIHYCEQPLPIGSEVRVSLVWSTRLDHMQQHCGEHILSHAFWQLCGANNIGFHMSEKSVFIDLDREVGPEEIENVEDFANEQVWANKPVTVSYFTPEELADREMRKKNENLTGLLRIVVVEDGDSCTCCGTHPPFTGMVGSIKIISAERHRGGMRIEFVCGKRALADARRKHEAISAANVLLSVKPEEVPTAVRKLKEEMADMAAKLKSRTVELFALRKESLLKQAHINHEGVRHIFLFEEDCTSKDAKLLAQVLTDEEGVTAGIFYRSDDRLNYVFMSSKGGADCRELCRKANEVFGGKGGGNAVLAQGGASYAEDCHLKIRELEKHR